MDKNSWVPDSGSFLQPSADNAIGLANNEAQKTMPGLLLQIYKVPLTVWCFLEKG